MGYFSSGTEGALYQERWCMRCHHDRDQDCPVWLAHLVHNYDDDRGILDQVIPVNGVQNGQCRMFVRRDSVLSDEALVKLATKPEAA